MMRPVKCFICNEHMYYSDDKRHEPEMKIKDDRYCHLRCWVEMVGEEPVQEAEWTHEQIAEEQKKIRLNILQERYSDVELRAELLRREAVREKEEAKVERPKINSIAGFDPLCQVCEQYLDYLESNGTKQGRFWKKRIYQKAIVCLYGHNALFWIARKLENKE